MTTTLSATPGYGLGCPTSEDAIQSLGRVGGPDQAREIWKNACVSAGVPATGPLSTEQMIRAATALKAQPGIIGVIGGSILVRVQSFQLLSSKAIP